MATKQNKKKSIQRMAKQNCWFDRNGTDNEESIDCKCISFRVIFISIHPHTHARVQSYACTRSVCVSFLFQFECRISDLHKEFAMQIYSNPSPCFLYEKNIPISSRNDDHLVLDCICKDICRWGNEANIDEKNIDEKATKAKQKKLIEKEKIQNEKCRYSEVLSQSEI